MCPGNPLQTCGAAPHALSAHPVDAFPLVAASCYDYFKLGIYPAETGCITLKAKNSSGDGVESIKCCKGGLNPQNSAEQCDKDDAYGLDGKCYYLSLDPGKELIALPTISAEL
jgi:hypothetical protein